MEELIIKEYNLFENSFNQKIKSIVPITSGNYCYLIKDNWLNNIHKLINSKKNNQLYNNKDNNILLSFKNEEPEFIDDISSVLDCLSKKIKIKFISINLLELIYDQNILKKHNQVSFCTGYNKIIIEYKEKPDNALLIVNPLENISKVLLISTTLNKLNLSLVNEKNQLYKELLNKEQLNLDNIYKKFNQIINNFKDFSDIYSNQIIKNNIENNYIKSKIDARYKKDVKNNLNRSMEYDQSDFSTNKILIEKNVISTIPNESSIRQN